MVIGIDPRRQDSPEIVSQFAAQTGVSFPLGWDADDSYERFRQSVPDAISPYPLDVVVGPDGTVALVRAQFDVIEIRAAIDNLLAN